MISFCKPKLVKPKTSNYLTTTSTTKIRVQSMKIAANNLELEI